MSESSTLVAFAAESEGSRIVGKHRTVQTGVGKSQMAHGLTVAIAEERPSAVVLVGVCGAYPEEHLGIRGVKVLDLCLVDVDRFADEGVRAPGKFVSIDALGFPPGGPYLADQLLLRRAQDMLPDACVVRGATVSSCSGEDVSSREIAARSGAMVETMEGAAAALVCARMGVPFLQLRCVSNFTGDREKASFDLDGAIDRAQSAALELLAVG